MYSCSEWPQCSSSSDYTSSSISVLLSNGSVNTYVAAVFDFCSQCLQESRIDCHHNVCHGGYLHWQYPTALSNSMNNKKNSTKTVFPIYVGAFSARRECQLLHYTFILSRRNEENKSFCSVCSS